jgi:hemoglobin-like flavoprotein
VKFVLDIREDSEETQLKLYMLGKSHASKFIKPYLYSVFVQTLLQTVAFRLGTDATNQIMEAWVNQFAFVMRSMLPGN